MKKLLISLLVIGSLIGVGIASWVISETFITPTEELVTPEVGGVESFLK